MSDDTSLNLFQQQEANRRRTVLLVIGFVAFFAWLGFGGDYIYFLATRDAPRFAYHHTVPWFGIALTVLVIVLCSGLDVVAQTLLKHFTATFDERDGEPAVVAPVPTFTFRVSTPDGVISVSL